MNGPARSLGPNRAARCASRGFFFQFVKSPMWRVRRSVAAQALVVCITPSSRRIGNRTSRFSRSSLSSAASCNGYLAHLFEKETPWAFTARHYFQVRWHSAIVIAGGMVLMDQRKQGRMGRRPSGKACTGCRRGLPKTSSAMMLPAGWTWSSSWMLSHVVPLQAAH